MIPWPDVIQEELLKEPPEDVFEERELEQGRPFTYLSIDYVRQRLNEVFGPHWSHEVLDPPVMHDYGKTPKGTPKHYCLVRVRLTILMGGSETREAIHVEHTEYGAGIGYGVGELSLQTVKKAASDGLKRAAAHIGPTFQVPDRFLTDDHAPTHAEPTPVPRPPGAQQSQGVPAPPLPRG